MEGKSDDVSALKPVMQTELELSFVKKVRVLLHVAKLELGIRRDRVT